MAERPQGFKVDPIAPGNRPAGFTVDPVAGGGPVDQDPNVLDVGVGPQSLEELTGGFVNRGAFTLAGGLTGGAVGAGGGAIAGAPAAGVGAAPGALAGGIAGGALGTAAGEFAFDTVEEAARFLGLIEGQLEPLGVRAERAAKSAVTDATFAMGFPALVGGITGLSPLFEVGKRGVGAALGVNNQVASEIAEAAQRQGIGLGAVDTVKGIRGRVLRGGAKVLSIFPWIGSPFRGAQVTKSQKIVSSVNDTLNAFAPNAVMADELGIDMVAAAKGVRKEFVDTAGDLFTTMRKLGSELDDPNIVPTKAIKKAVTDFVAEAKSSQITLTAAEGETAEVLTGGAADELAGFIKKLTDLPEKISLAQVDGPEGVSTLLERFVKRAQADGFDVKRVATIKGAIEDAIGKLEFSTSEAPERVQAVLEARDTARSFFAEGIVKFQTPTAKKFEQVDRNIFRAGFERPGTRDAEELSGVVDRISSPQAVDDLVSLVGKDNAKRAARLSLDKAWDAALLTDDANVITGIDIAAFAKNTISSTNALTRQKWERVFETAGIDVADFRDVMKVASNITISKDVNAFIARRAALGGLGAAVGGATLPRMLGDGLLDMFAVGLLLRKGMKLISSPADLAAMKAITTPSSASVIKRQALGRLIESFGRIEETERREGGFLSEEIGS